MVRHSLAVLVTLSSLNAPLSAGDLRVDGQLISDAPQGTPPIQVGSTTPVPNLNADLLDGMTSGDFAGVSELAMEGSGVGVHWKNLINVPGVEIDQDCAANTGCETGADTAGFPVTITEPGSYRLAGNLTNSSEHVDTISIESSNVVLDLNGFALLGPVACTGTPVTSCTPSGALGIGVAVTAPDVGSSVTIMNGSIQGMGRLGIHCTAPCKIVQVHVSQSDHVGISTSNADAIVENVISYRNGGSGFHMNGILRNCQATGNGLIGVENRTNGTISVENCTATQNASDGYSITGSVANSKASGNGLNGFRLLSGTTVVGNAAHDNGSSGFLTPISAGLTLTDNTAHSNNVHGFDIDEALLIGNTASANGDDGFVCTDCVLLNNLSVDNTGNGVVFEGVSSVWGGNTLLNNGADQTGTVADRGNNFCDGVAC